jgi:hypothetical protein
MSINYVEQDLRKVRWISSSTMCRELKRQGLTKKRR